MTDERLHDTRAADLARDPFAVVIVRADNGWIAAVPSEMRDGHEYLVTECRHLGACGDVSDQEADARALADLLFECFPSQFGRHGMRITVGDEEG